LGFGRLMECYGVFRVSTLAQKREWINRMYYTINKRGSKKKIREFMHVVYTRTNTALNRFQIDLWFDWPLNQHEMSVHRN
jgi:hypothetical protein